MGIYIMIPFFIIIRLGQYGNIYQDSFILLPPTLDSWANLDWVSFYGQQCKYHHLHK